ncbi:LacI family DNA-binding transcriptional regulator [Georgenia thermotolerans]|uniref:Substrate-binding domain-containing protein n=1 Tax=Georgenia thermotolerans TaxID=527326 RepID=A0A7J5URG2_9MICO|nr:LacI family DNA-binding transcriptional regulator [Georgenia thermotolerans]KAE8764810.1 substrate-binding domain-containing protein [Georgenia thermotolerans]
MARATLKDVAARAGVSRSTASLVVSGSSRISPQTSERVRRAMAELGYVYDRSAANLRRARTGTLGLVLTDLSNPYFAALVMALEDQVHREGRTLLIGCSRDDAARQAELLTAMAEHRVDGVLLLPAHASTADVTAPLDAHGIPLVMFARHLSGPTPYVGPDNVEAGRLLGRHLAATGMRSVVLLGGPPDSSAWRERSEGLRAGAAGAFELVTEPATGVETAAAAADAVAELLGGGAWPDCIVGYNDVVAMGVATGLRRAGVTPGPDVAVAGFDDIPAAEQQVPPLTSVATRAEEVGRTCAAVLLDLLAGQTVVTGPRLVPPALRVRASTGSWRPRRHRPDVP